MQKSETVSNNLAHKFKVVYNTTKGKPYPMEIGFAIVPASDISLDIGLTTEACRKGCNLYGRNGGCPPLAPKFTDIPGKELLVLYASLLTAYFPPRVLEGPYYSRWVFIETFMTPLMNRIGKALASHLSGFFLSSGNCHGCRPKRCAVKENMPCRAPHRRTFSLEATGVLVTEVMKGAFGLHLEWWEKQNLSYMPRHMCKVVGVKGNGLLSEELETNFTHILLQDRLQIMNKEP